MIFSVPIYIYDIITYFINYLNKETYSILISFIGIISGFLGAWIYIVYILITKLHLNSQSININEIVKKPSRFYWRYLGVNICYLFITFAPSVLIFLLLNNLFLNPDIFEIQKLPEYLKIIKFIIISIISIIPMLFFGIKYYFVGLSAIFENKEIDTFSNSSDLVKGKFWLVLLGISLVKIVLVFIALFEIFSSKTYSAIHKLVFDILISVFLVFFQSFSQVFDTIFYLKLKEINVDLISEESNNDLKI